MRFSDLIDSSESLLPGVFNRAVVDDYEVNHFVVKDMVGVRTKLVTAEFSGPNDAYKVVVQVSGIVPGEKCSEENHMVVRCSCPAFRFWFGVANRDHHVLFGPKIKRYIPVADHLRQRPKQAPKNPGHIPGVCKHIIGLIKVMKRDGIME
jgi:hypothetical protein